MTPIYLDKAYRIAILGEAFADARLQCSPKLRDGPKKKPKLWSAFPRVGVYFSSFTRVCVEVLVERVE